MVSPTTQRAAKLIIEEALEAISEHGSHPVTGIVFPIQDTWGMGGEDGVITLTCFCTHCRSALAAKGVDLAKFRGYPSPWNLLLKDSVSGISPIDQLSRTTTPDEIVSISIEKRFQAADELEAAKQLGTDEEDRRRHLLEATTRLTGWATDLKGYMDAISSITKEAIMWYCDVVRSHGLKCAVIVGSESYEWATRIYFDDLDDADFVDEIWTEPSNSHGVLSSIAFRNYLYKRGRYHLDGFFESTDFVDNDRSRVLMGLSGDRLERLFHRRMEQATQREYHSRLDVEALPEAENCRGAVVPMFDRALAQQIGQNLFGEGWEEALDLDRSSSSDVLEGLEALLRRAEE